LHGLSPNFHIKVTQSEIKMPVLFLRNRIDTLERHDTKNSKQIFPEKKLRGFSMGFHSHVSLSNLLFIPRIGLPILLQENMWTDPYKNRS
jgi:hypothetical protein